MSLLSKIKKKIKDIGRTIAGVSNTKNAGASGVGQTTPTGLPSSGGSSGGKKTDPTAGIKQQPGLYTPAPTKPKPEIGTGAYTYGKGFNYGTATNPNYNYGLPPATQSIAPKKTDPFANIKQQPGLYTPYPGVTTTRNKSGGSSGSRNTGASSISSYSTFADYGLGFDSGAAAASFSSDGGGSGTGTGSYTGGSKTGTKSSGGGVAGGVNDIASELERIQREGEMLQGEVNKLYEQEQNAANDAVASDTEEVNLEEEAMKKLKDAGLWPGDENIKMFDQELKDLRQRQREYEQSINQNYNVQQQGMIGEQANETGQLSVGIANAGGYLGFSGSGTGVMLKLAESHRAELNALESQRQNALQEARNAAAERRFDIVRLKADEIARLDQERYERVQEYNKEVKAQAQADLERAKEIEVQNLIFDAIQKGNKTPADIFKALKGKASIQEVGSFLEGIDKSSGDKFKFSASEATSLLGAGMSSDDVSALSEAVNEYGYTDEIRAQLTPAQRVAADKIYRGKTSGDTTAFVTENGTAISDTTMQVLDGFTSLKSLTASVRQKVKNELYELGFGSETPPKWFTPETAAEMYGEPLSLQMLEDYYKFNSAPGFESSNLVKWGKKFAEDMWKMYRNRIFASDPGLENSAGLSTNLDDIDINSIPSE